MAEQRQEGDQLLAWWVPGLGRCAYVTRFWFCVKDFLPRNSYLTFPAVLEDERSLSVLSKLTAVQMARWSSSPYLDDRCCRLRILWLLKISPPSHDILSMQCSRPSSDTIERLHQPAWESESCCCTCQLSQSREGSVLAKGVAVRNRTCFQLLDSESLVHPPKSGFTKLLMTDHPSVHV